MEYTDTIKRLIKDYQLTPQDVLFAMLLSLGTGRAETFLHIYQPSHASASALTNGAAKLLKDKPQIIKLVNDLKERNKIIPLSADLDTIKEARKNIDRAKTEGWNKDQTPEENLKRILINELYKLDPGEKVKTAQNIAKLFGVKEDIKETRHYYLPISCRHCKLYIEEEDRKRIST